MLKIYFSNFFIKKIKKLKDDLQDEVFEKINLLKDESNHQSLKVHKLHGRFSKYYSFSVNYKYRIVFDYLSKKEIRLHDFGGHEIYK